MSMAREEVIKRLKELKARCERLSVSSGTYPMKWRADAEAVGMAIAALRPISRELVKKMRGEWVPVEESRITGFNPVLAGRDPIGGYVCSKCKIEAVLDCNDEFVLDNFCPRCGAPMNDEAIDTMADRLEAIFSERNDE